MTILPILKRDLMVAARRGHESVSRSFFAVAALVGVLGTFTAWYFWEGEYVTNRLMTLIAERAFLLMLGLHTIPIFEVLGRSAGCVAEEKDRRTIEFLLATSLNSGEIILGRFTARMIAFLGTLASGLPVMLVLNRLGGIDGWLILMAYAGIASTGLFLAAMSIWVSAEARDSRRAMGTATLVACGWLWVPLTVAGVLPRFGVRFPDWMLSINGLLMNSSPLVLLMRMPGLAASPALVDVLERMCGLQLLLAVGCLLAATIRLRPACRAWAERRSGEDGRLFAARRSRLRRAVGDDPILWREVYTGRPRGLARLMDLLIYAMIAGAIAYPTWFFGKLAAKELWAHGYLSASPSAKAPEFNLITRFYVSGNYSQIDQARVEFNFLLRLFTVSLAYFLLLAAAGLGFEGIAAERRRETWTSLLATPLLGREIMRAKLLGMLWRFRRGLGTVLVLWVLDLLVGSLHPLGFVFSLLVFAGWLWFVAVWAMCAAIKVTDPSRDAQGSRSLLIILVSTTAALPYLLPGGLNSILWGSCSPLLVLWLTQFSYRDLGNLTFYHVYPHLQWIGIKSGEGAIPVCLTSLLGIVMPALGGLWFWRHGVKHFDRLVGRPWRETPEEPATSEVERRHALAL